MMTRDSFLLGEWRWLFGIWEIPWVGLTFFFFFLDFVFDYVYIA